MTTWEDRTGRVQQAVDAWSMRLRQPEVAAPGSSLAADDRVWPEMPCSQLAWWAISVAVEHLDATLRLLAEQVGRGGPLLPAANFTTLRAGLVGAAQAVVLLVPTSREERCNYGLRLAHEEYVQALNFRREVLESKGLVGEAREAAEHADYLSRLESSRDRAAALLAERGVPRPKLFDTAMVRAAAKLVHSSGSDAELLQLAQVLEWRLGSGAAHGRLLMALHRSGGHRMEEGGTALFGANYQDIAMPLVGVSLMLNEAMRCWDLRRQPTWVDAAPAPVTIVDVYASRRRGCRWLEAR